ncbi:glycosyltransferase family 25 protein [Phaeosphaeria sp. MPI-PUGE-AT-0046c]|nr:glycosyltransferase family 25 protein [Phaeosphaeria sp. MPI-PUGE-AT-0046c]
MPSRSHGRLCLAAAVCCIISLLLLRTHFAIVAESGQGINNSTLGFQTILAINAPWRTDRKDSLVLASMQGGISLEWIDGINGSLIDERAFPQGNHRLMPKGNLGSWRAHIDAMRIVIERNLSTALIIEDDTDWDPRIRSQLSSVAFASQRLPDKIARAELAARNHVPSRDDIELQDSDLDPIELSRRSTLALPTTFLQSFPVYGSDWDVLWLGHCSGSLPPKQNISAMDRFPDRYMLLDDVTVPAPRVVKASPASPYPPHTRVYHRTHNTLCTLAYAVTQRGARKIMYEHGIRNFDRGYDFALGEWCDGVTKNMGERPLCLTSTPPIFSHFYGNGGAGRSDIAAVGGNGVKSGVLDKSVRESVEDAVDGVDL